LDVERAGSSPYSAGAVHSPHSTSIVGSSFPLVRCLCDHRRLAFPAARIEKALSRLASEFPLTEVEALALFGIANVSVERRRLRLDWRDARRQFANQDGRQHVPPCYLFRIGDVRGADSI
jgi:hypothetical protein